MANDLTNNPWVIDTAAAGALTAQLMRIVTVRWIGATNAAHTAIITNSAGKVVWFGAAATADHSEESHPAGYRREGFNTLGLIVPTLGSGALYVEYA